MPPQPNSLAAGGPVSGRALSRAERLLSAALEAVQEAKAGAPGKREYRCGACNEVGHAVTTCSNPRNLYRCDLCGGLVWEHARIEHLRDGHDLELLGDYFDACEKNTRKSRDG